MASCYWIPQCDSVSEEEVSDLEYDISVGVGDGGAPASKCGGRGTDAAAKPDDKGVRPELFEKNITVEFDKTSKKRSRLHGSLRRDDVKRSRPPFTPDMCPRQARGRTDKPDVVNMQTMYRRSEAWVDGAFEATLRQSSCEGPRFLSSKSHVDIPGFGHAVNHRRTSWRDGATDSIASCIISSSETPELGMRCLDMVAVRDADSAWAAVHTEFESSKGFVRVSGERGAVECTVDIYSKGESGLPDQMGEPLLDLNAEPNCVQRPPSYPLLGELLCSLKKGDEEYQDIESKFLGGLGKFSSDTIVTGISRDASPRGHARLQAFEKLEEATRKARGDANVRFAWHGTSKTGVSGIFLHGFGQPRTPKNGCAYGVGVYLAPEGQSHVSAVYADNDENGEQHVVLCRVILGASELVKQGSDQFHPSSVEFDTGVDDLVSPRRLIVWSTHMNTHVLPLYVVSFKLPPRWHQMMAAFHGKKASTICHLASMKRYCTARQVCQEAKNETGMGLFCKQGPTSPAISFPNLFLLLTPLLAADRLQCLRDSYEEFQAKRLPRPKLIQHLRDEVGDHRLLHAIKLLQGSQMSKEQEQIKYETPQ